MNIDDLDYEDLRTLAGMYSNYVQEFCYLTDGQPVSIFEYLEYQWEDDLKARENGE